MQSVLEILAAPSQVLIPSGHVADKHAYFATVTRVYALLRHIHGQVLDQLMETSLSQSRAEAEQLLTALLNPSSLAGHLRAHNLCDELQERGTALLQSGLLPPNSEATDVVAAFSQREQGVAEFYVQEFEPMIIDALQQASNSDFQSALRRFRDTIVRQQAGFMVQGEKAIGHAQE